MLNTSFEAKKKASDELSTKSGINPSKKKDNTLETL